MNHGVPFRDAHGIVGQLCTSCIEKGISLDELSISEYKAISPVFEEVFTMPSVSHLRGKENDTWRAGPEVMENVIQEHKTYLEEE